MQSYKTNKLDSMPDVNIFDTQGSCVYPYEVLSEAPITSRIIFEESDHEESDETETNLFTKKLNIKTNCTNTNDETIIIKNQSIQPLQSPSNIEVIINKDGNTMICERIPHTSKNIVNCKFSFESSLVGTDKKESDKTTKISKTTKKSKKNKVTKDSLIGTSITSKGKAKENKPSPKNKPVEEQVVNKKSENLLQNKNLIDQQPSLLGVTVKKPQNYNLNIQNKTNEETTSPYFNNQTVGSGDLRNDRQIKTNAPINLLNQRLSYNDGKTGDSSLLSSRTQCLQEKNCGYNFNNDRDTILSNEVPPQTVSNENWFENHLRLFVDLAEIIISLIKLNQTAAESNTYAINVGSEVISTQLKQSTDLQLTKNKTFLFKSAYPYIIKCGLQNIYNPHFISNLKQIVMKVALEKQIFFQFPVFLFDIVVWEMFRFALQQNNDQQHISSLQEQALHIQVKEQALNSRMNKPTGNPMEKRLPLPYSSIEHNTTRYSCHNRNNSSNETKTNTHQCSSEKFHKSPLVPNHPVMMSQLNCPTSINNGNDNRYYNLVTTGSPAYFLQQQPEMSFSANQINMQTNSNNQRQGIPNLVQPSPAEYCTNVLTSSRPYDQRTLNIQSTGFPTSIDQEHVRSSVSRDSGFTSPECSAPLNSIGEVETDFTWQALDPIHGENEEYAMPCITHVTSLNPHVKRNQLLPCAICTKPTTLHCMGCSAVFYCSATCHTIGWYSEHQYFCAELKKSIVPSSL